MKLLFFSITILLSTCLAFASGAERIKTRGVGDNLEINKEGMSSEQLKTYDLFKKHCTSCHSEHRIVVALNSREETDDAQYEEYLKETVLKKIRLSKGKMSHQEAKLIHEFLKGISRSVNGHDIKPHETLRNISVSNNS